MGAWSRAPGFFVQLHRSPHQTSESSNGQDAALLHMQALASRPRPISLASGARRS